MASKPATSPLEKLNVTKEEVENIAKAMKNEEFRKLLKDYVDEISDPKNKALYEQEIEALEADRGNNIRWVKPTPGRVIKTFFTEKPPKQTAGMNGEAIEIPTNVKKVFINICTSSEVEEAKPESGSASKDKRGLGWSVPYSLTPGRFDVDKAGGQCFVYDCVFHPKTFEIGCKNPRFMEEIIISTAMDGIEQRFSVKLDRAYKSVKMSYKGEIKSTVVRTKAEKPNSAQEMKQTSLDFLQQITEQKQEGQKPSARPPPPTKTIITGNRYKAATLSAAATASDLTKTEELHVTPQPQRKPFIQEISSTSSSKPQSSTSIPPKQLETPVYTLTHRASRSYSNYLESRDRSQANPPRPDALVLKIELPKCESMHGVSLDILKDGWECQVRVPGVYHLSVDLPFEVVETDGTAKFDKAKRVLVVDVPCVPAPVEALPEADAPLEVDEPEKSVEEEIDPETPIQEDINTSPDADLIELESPSTLVSELDSTIPLLGNDIPEILVNGEPLDAKKEPTTMSTAYEVSRQGEVETVEEDLYSALQNLKPAVPTEQELQQLAESAKKSGVLQNIEPLWSIQKHQEQVTGRTGVEVEPAEISAAAESEKKRATSLKLMSHLIYELDD